MAEPNLDQTSNPTGDGGGEPPAFDPSSIAETPFVELLTDEELRTSPALKDYKGLEGLAKAHIHLQRMMGGDENTLLRMPGEEATEEERASFYSKLGRPETPDGYTVPELPNREQLGIADDTINGFLHKAHEMGLSDQQAQAMLGWYGEWANEQMQSQTTQHEDAVREGMQAMKREWGAAFEENLAKAERALQAVGGPELADLLAETGLANNPAVVKLFHKVAESMREDVLMDGGEAPSGTAGALSPAQAQGEINALKGDASFMQKYNDPTNPGHDEAVARMQKLFAFAYPQTQ